MKKLNWIFLLFVVAAWGCSPSVQTDKEEGVDLAKYDTYAYLPSGDSVSSKVVFTEQVMDEVSDEMKARGYSIDNANPDLLVLVRSMYDQEEYMRRDPVYTSYDYYRPGFNDPVTLSPYYYTGYSSVGTLTGYNIDEVEYTEGTFVVDVIDADSKQIVWRGWSETPVDPMDLDTSIDNYVDNIFDEYPVDANN